MDKYRYVTIKEVPEKKDMAAHWFYEKWHVSKEAYLQCMDAYLNGETQLGWYLCLKDDEIIGGM